MKYLRIAALIPILIQVISELITVVEDSTMRGEEKREAVIDGLLSIWTGIFLEFNPNWAKYPVDTVIRIAGLLVDNLVALKHAVGLFTRKPPEPIPIPS